MDGTLKKRNTVPESVRESFAYYPIPKAMRIVTAIVTILFCVLIPISVQYRAVAVMWSLMTATFCCVFFLMTSKNKIIPSLTVMVFIGSISLFGSPVIPAIALGLVISVGACSFLIDFCDPFSTVCLALVPVLSYLVSFALTKDALLSAASLLPCPVILCQGMLCRNQKEKKSAVCATAAVCVLSLAAFAAIYMIENQISLYSLPDSLERARAALAGFLTEKYKNVPTEMLGSSAAAFGLSAANAIFNIIPALVCICALVAAYLSHSYHYRIRDAFDISLPENEAVYRIQISTAAAFLFLAAFICSFTTDSSGNETLFSSVSENLYLMLLPGVALAGMNTVTGWIVRTRVRIPFVIALIAIILFSLYFQLIMALAFVGAACIIIKSADKWAAGKETGK